MRDCECTMPTHDGEQHVIAAAQHILKALAMSKNVSCDMRKILEDFGTHLSTMAKVTENVAEEGANEVEDQLKNAQEKIINWQLNQSRIWDSSPEEASEYLKAVSEVQRLTESLGGLPSNRSGKYRQLLDQAHSVLQMAMSRLEEELIHILNQSKQSFPRDPVPVHSCEDIGICDESIVSNEECIIEDNSRRESTDSEVYMRELVHPNVIANIKSIANVMFASNYGLEFCQAFVSFWEEALNEHMAILGVNYLTIEDLLKLEWKILHCKIKKWRQAMKVIVRFYLAREKQLFSHVLGEFGSVYFVEASKSSVLCLLNFGHAIAIGPRQPERLSCLLDMYEVLADLLQDIDALYSEAIGSFLRIEFHELLGSLRDSARVTFMEFGHHIASCNSTSPFPSGGVIHLTKYVMNYIILLAAYDDTFNLLFEDQDRKDLDPNIEFEQQQNSSLHVLQPVARCFQSLTSILESNLEKRSDLYIDASLKHIFMMNNICYMVQKVKDSEVRTYFGDEWIRRHNAKFQLHARNYVRTTWCSILPLLRDDGSTGKAILKERCRGFNMAFEEVYKRQTGWSIPDANLREDLRILTSERVIPVYRNFFDRITRVSGDKHIKYSIEDLENYILHLFEGSQRSLHHFRVERFSSFVQISTFPLLFHDRK